MRRPLTLWLTLAIGLIAVTLWACMTGPFDVSLAALWSMLTDGTDHTATQAAVFAQIRVPRVVLGLLVGGTLGVTGALTQGVFRNPLAEPALIGIGSGAALAATVTIAFGGTWIAAQAPWVAAIALPAAAFMGAIGCAWGVHLAAVRGGRTSVTTMLLVGIALNALCFAGIGVVQAVADDAALRGLTFWLLGSLSGATWQGLLIAGPLMLATILFAPRLGRALDAFMLGEMEAGYLGVRTERLKRTVVGVTAIGVGAAVALCGLIGFIGLVVPHVVRLALTSLHRTVLPAAAIVGAALLVAADTVSRVIIAPAELPVGVVTTLIGVPVFAGLLFSRRVAVA